MDKKLVAVPARGSGDFLDFILTWKISSSIALSSAVDWCIKADSVCGSSPLDTKLSLRPMLLPKEDWPAILYRSVIDIPSAFYFSSYIKCSYSSRSRYSRNQTILAAASSWSYFCSVTIDFSRLWAVLPILMLFFWWMFFALFTWATVI